MINSLYKNKFVLIGLFLILIIMQWFVPLKMYLDQKSILKNGTEFKFKIEPIDPYDPFRGKYITLRFDISNFKQIGNLKWENGDEIFIKLKKNSLGFAVVDSVFKKEPLNNSNYFKTKINNFTNENDISIEIPFNRYYMEESKAPLAENLLQFRNNDSLKLKSYAIVMLKSGNAALKSVIVNNKPIEKYIEEQKTKEKN